MKRKNRILVTLAIVMMALFAESAVARLQKDARECVKPRFSKFTPAHLSEVAPGSTVSFIANHSTGKASIKVTAKEIEINDLRITDNNSFYVVEFELPESLKDTYVRLHISAQAKVGPISCKHKDGWLLKISGDQAAAGSKPKAEVAAAVKPKVAAETQANVEAVTEPVATEAAAQIDNAATNESEQAESGAKTAD